jgi:hypothetical protein
MKTYELTVDVQCHRPNWVFSIHNTLKYETSYYRIYVNETLLIERNWVWPNDTLIQEKIMVVLDVVPTNIYLEPVLKNPAQAVFKLDNLQVADTSFTSEQINDLTISFTL